MGESKPFPTKSSSWESTTTREKVVMAIKLLTTATAKGMMGVTSWPKVLALVERIIAIVVLFSQLYCLLMKEVKRNGSKDGRWALVVRPKGRLDTAGRLTCAAKDLVSLVNLSHFCLGSSHVWMVFLGFGPATKTSDGTCKSRQ